MFTPADGKIVMVNPGFVPERRHDAKTRPRGQITGLIDIVGSMRWPEARHWFTPDDEPAKNLWLSADPQAIAAAKGIGAVAPF